MGIETKLQIANTKINGEVQWNKILYNDLFPQYNVAYAVSRDPNNNYYITGTAGDGILCMKMNSNFVTEWSRIYKQVDGDLPQGIGVICLNDSLTVITGYIQDGGFLPYSISKDIIFIGIDERGDTLWTRSIGSTSDDRPYSLDSANSASFLISGTTYGLATEKGYDGFLVSFDPTKENCNYRKCEIELDTIVFSESDTIIMGAEPVSADTTVEWIADTIFMHNACECSPPTAHFEWEGVDGLLTVYYHSVWTEHWHWVIDDVPQSEDLYYVHSFGDNVNACLIAENACGSDEYCEILSGGVDVKEINLISLKAFPVPSSDKVFMQFNNQTGMDIRVIDALGRSNKVYSDYMQNSLILSKEETGIGIFLIMFMKESSVVALKKIIFR